MSGRVCVVTGANAGIGKATAMGLAQQGAHVVLACRSVSKVSCRLLAVSYCGSVHEYVCSVCLCVSACVSVCLCLCVLRVCLRQCVFASVSASVCVYLCVCACVSIVCVFCVFVCVRVCSALK